jgi:xanthine/uracil/vitamin C permease (AzgA family)
VRRLLLLATALVFLDVLFFTMLAPLLPSVAARFGLSDAQLALIHR